MKKIIVILNILLISMLVSCRKQKYDIVTTLYPNYAIAKEISSDLLNIKLLTPPGSDSHSYEPSSQEMIEIIDSKLFIYVSNSMEPWVKKSEKSNSTYLNLYENIKLKDPNISDDVHFFMSLEYHIETVDIILKEIINVDKENENIYTANANLLKENLSLLNDHLLEILQKDIYFIGHNVFESFEKQTNLTFYSLLDEFTDESNPSSAEIESMHNLLQNNNISVLYYDSLNGLEMAQIIKDDMAKKGLDLTLLPLHTFHNVTRKLFDSVTITALWEENIINLGGVLDGN